MKLSVLDSSIGRKINFHSEMGSNPQDYYHLRMRQFLFIFLPKKTTRKQQININKFSSSKITIFISIFSQKWEFLHLVNHRYSRSPRTQFNKIFQSSTSTVAVKKIPRKKNQSNTKLLEIKKRGKLENLVKLNSG